MTDRSRMTAAQEAAERRRQSEVDRGIARPSTTEASPAPAIWVAPSTLSLEDLLVAFDKIKTRDIQAQKPLWPTQPMLDRTNPAPPPVVRAPEPDDYTPDWGEKAF